VKYRIARTKRARSDLVAIARYTLATWGPDQTRDYLAELDKTIAKLGQLPLSVGLDRAKLKPGLRSVLHGKEYIIFYRVRGDYVEIIRILRQRQDWMRRMKARG